MAKPIFSNLSFSSRSALSSRTFRFYFGGSCFSTFATWITRFLLGWLAWDLTEQAFWVGVVSAAMLLPTFLLSPVFGVLSDRISARNGMLGTTFLQASIGAMVAIVEARGSLTITWLIVVATAIGAVSSAHHPMRLSLIPKLVEREQLPSAIGLSAIVFNSSRIIGPAIAAWLVANISVATAFGVAASLFLFALLFLLGIHAIPRGQLKGKRSVMQDLKAGLGFIRASATVKLVLALTMINGLVGRSVIELLPAISGRLTGGEAGVLAVLTAFAGVGSILGGVIISRQPGNEQRMLQITLLCLLAGGVVLLPSGFVSAVPVLSGIVLLLSMTMTMIGTSCQALIQLNVDESFRGRVLSIWTVVSMGVPAFGAFMMGATADMLGFGPVLATFALLSIAFTLAASRYKHVVENAYAH
jgi:MFS family permease